MHMHARRRIMQQCTCMPGGGSCSNAHACQAEDRLHRRGQRAAVNVTLLLAHAPPTAPPRNGEGTEAAGGKSGGGGGGGGGGGDALQAVAAFDARHYQSLRQSERGVRHVTPQESRVR